MEISNKKILLITSTNLFSNPRLVKEITLFTHLKYEVTVICFKIGIADEESFIIEKQFPEVKFIHLSALRSNILKWLFVTLIHRVSLICWSFFKNSLSITAYASNKRTILIHQFLRKKHIKYDIVIAHTLAPLYAAFKYSSKNGLKLSFDMEDYHPGELIKTNVKEEKKRREYLLKKILPNTVYTSFASPLFKEEVIKKLQINLTSTFSLYNGFSKNEFPFISENNSSKVELIWYSLSIDKGRGLEEILPIINQLSQKVNLTIIGKLNPEFDKKYNISNSNHINYLGYLPQEKLHKIICESDIGLALEQTNTDLNRDLCLTNKIISYCQSGIYIFASNTKAQSMLLREHPDLGIISTNFYNDLNVVIKNIENIRNNKAVRFNIGQSFSWENQQQKLINIIKNV